MSNLFIIQMFLLLCNWNFRQNTINRTKIIKTQLMIVTNVFFHLFEPAKIFLIVYIKNYINFAIAQLSIIIHVEAN